MTAKQTKIRELTKCNQNLEQELRASRRKIDILLGEGDRRMFDIGGLIDSIEECFSKEITWNEISPNPDGQLRFLKRTLSRIREIARHNQND